MSIDPIRTDSRPLAPLAPTERVRPSIPSGPVSEPPRALPAGDRLRLGSRSPLDADLRLASLAETTPPLPSDSARKSEDAQGPSGSARTREQDGPKNPTDLDEDQKKQVAELERRDAAVRAHEQAHLAAAGPLAQGGPQFTYETGPDGKRYATGGEVKIVMRSGSTPEETVRNAERVQAAALAPGDPSPTDQRTAASATRAAQEARQQASASERGDGTGQPTGVQTPEPPVPSPVPANPGA